MGHNTTNQKAASYVRAQFLDTYADWVLVAGCGRCSRETRMAIRPIAERSSALTISQTLARLRCTACGGQPSAVSLERGKRGIALKGPGSY